jgi:UDP-glucose 4-epimerase
LDPTIKNDTFNIGPDEEFITIRRLAETICQELDYTGDIVYFPERPKEIKYATCDSTKARTILGYQTGTSFIDGLRSTIAYIKERGVKPFDYSNYPLEIVNQYTPKTWSERLM